MKNFKKHWPIFTICVLLLANFVVFKLDFENSNRGLTFAVLDVGQGDALFIESPTGTQVLFDTGPVRKLSGPLSRVMSFFDKSIDAVVITNPDADHIGSFSELVSNYNIGNVFEPGTYSESEIYEDIQNTIKEKDIKHFYFKKGMRLVLGGGVFIDVLFPDKDVSAWSSNDGSVIARLTYGKTSIMLTGDATIKTEEIVLKNNLKENIKSTFLKVGHHGSRTSTSFNFIKNVFPKYAFISSGKDNKYGHSHREVIDDLESLGVKVFRTDLLGTIILKSDGINEVFDFKNQ